MAQSRSLVILGSGYTGRFLTPLASQQYDRVFSTSRNPDANLGGISVEQRIRFDLAEPDTWTQIPPHADLLWCFPAAPLEQVHRFAVVLQAPPRRLVVLASTSAYNVPHRTDDYPPPWTDESAPVDLTKPRVQGEECLRTDCGAIVLRVAGIYGPGRNPLDWIKTGRVAASRKYVNLIHIEDLASICLTALKHGKPGEVYNVSDGTPRTWDEIFRFAQQHCAIAPPASPARTESGKRISNRKLSRELGVTILHSDLYTQLCQS